MRYNPSDWQHVQCRKHLSPSRCPTLEAQVQAFSEICENFKPVMHHFFLENFPSPSSWYRSTLSYTRSSAVNSIVGYVAGLGDRHCQNILIDRSTAEVIHIDFGVAFEQGKALKTPETIPFRLTRDIVDGMGVSGCEGVFRRCCEETLRVLRGHGMELLSILSVLVHDPLYKWALSPLKALQVQQEQRDVEDKGSDPAAGILRDAFVDSEVGPTAHSQEAERVLLRVQQKLQGYEEGTSAALGVEGQVNLLLQQARDPERLAALFGGWAPWV